MQRLRVLVADDEPMARARLRRLLEQDGGVEVVAECSDGDEAVVAMNACRPDVAFLDIRMPNLDGFQVLDRVDRGRTRIVFVTAYSEHAVRAFDSDAVDYLLKPLSADRLQKALQRVRDARELPAGATTPSADRYPRRIPVPVAGRVHLLPVEEIDLLSSQGNYVQLHAGERQYLMRGTLAGVLAKLDPDKFLHVHRTRIVRVEAVRDVETLESGQYLLRLANGMRVATGRSYRNPVRERLGLP